jgi:hypothetical protein
VIRNILSIVIAMTAFALPAIAHAQEIDPTIEGAKQCTRHLARYEREYAIPTHLLSAIASTESGRYHKGLKIKLPWPWTINAQGKGYFFDSKEEAIAAVKKLRAHGVQSIDVGCMQVNLLQHPEAFSSLDQAFEPEYNIAYAASFLSSLYQEEGTWKKAASDYHSRTPTRGREYVGLVYNSWFQIIDKLRAARVQVPENSVAAAEAPKPVVLAEARSPEQQGHKVAARAHPHMNSIQLSARDKPEHDNGVLVVQPDVAAEKTETLTVADASSELPAPKVIHLDNNPVPIVPISTGPTPVSRKSGPNFIFDN